jgi:DNA-binding beta-propeller fold protein YncE
MRTSRTKLSLLLLTLLATVAFAATPALAARGHIFKESFKPTGPHALNEPAGVAVNEATGDVYVADKGDNRVEWFNPAGGFEGEFNTGPSVTGTGTTSEPTATGTGVKPYPGSDEVTGVVTTSFAPFAVGELISGGPIRPGTTIIEVREETPTEEALVLSSNLEGGRAGESFALSTGNIVVTGIMNESEFVVGEEITGEGIPAGTTITDLLGGGALEISNPVDKAELSVNITAHETLAAPEAVAIDNTCALHNLASEEACKTDPSAGDVYVIIGNLEEGSSAVVDKFSSTGAYLGQLAGASLRGLAVDPRGNLWVGNENGVVEFSNAEPNVPSPGIHARLEGGGNRPGFAVDSEDDFYIQGKPFEGSSVIAKIAPEGCPEQSGGCVRKGERDPSPGLLNEVFDPEGSDWLAAELTTSDVYVDHGATLDRRAPSGSLLESLPLAGGAGTGVAVNSQEEELYVAQGTAGDVEVFAKVPPAPPAVVSEEASNVTAESATLEAAIEPRSESSEKPTSYWFEYVSEAQFARSGFTGAARTPAASLTPTYDVDTVSPENVLGLSTDTTYRYRVFAENELGKIEGQQSGGAEVVHTFTTQATGSFTLPDGRTYEMVSPPDKHGAQLADPGAESPLQAAAAGGGVVYAAGSPTESEPRGLPGLVPVLSVRGSSSWSSRDLALPHTSPLGGAPGLGFEYRLFSADLSQAVVQPFGPFIPCSAGGVPQPCLSPEASEQTAFLATNFLEGQTSKPCLPASMPCYQPLVTAAPGFSNVLSPQTSFGEDEQCAGVLRPQPICGPKFVGATEDLAHVVFKSPVALTSPASGGLYEWSAGKPPSEQLAPVGILPPSEGEGPAGAGVVLGLGAENTRHAISEDGSRVFFGGAEAPIIPARSGPLYVRDLVKKETLLVAHKADFQDASADGSTVFYTEAGTLYECAISEVAGELKCTTTEIAPDVPGLIPGSSVDGSYLYFVSESAEIGGKSMPGAVAGQPNLYVRHAGATSLIAVLSPSDSPDWDTEGVLDKLTARVSPNGRYLAFMSQNELTGYDNRDASSGKPDEEVYLYDAGSGSHPAGSLTCASCDPTGARPVGSEYHNAEVVGGERVWPGGTTWLAADVPGYTPVDSGTGIYQPRYLSNSGRLFFDARDPLVSKAVGGSWDVYEYEPEGVPQGEHACTPSSTSGSDVFEPERTVQVEGRTVESGAGCVALLSSGESGQESAFLDASESGGEGPHGEQLQEGGGDVFFMTTAKLSKADTDNAYDVYDAHECTTESKCTAPAAGPPLECATEASCKPSPEPQPGIYGPPASATFSGPGNVAPEVAPPPKKITKKPAKCPKGKVRKTVKSKHGKAKSECVQAKPKKHKRKK